MKHLILLLACAISLMASSQVIPPYLQTFDGTTIPAGWSQSDNTIPPTGQIWKFGTTTYDPALTGNYAYINSDAYGAGGEQNADLISPTFDFTAITSVNLHFNHSFFFWDLSSATLSYSIDDGANWTVIKTWTTTTSNPEIFNQIIDGVAGESQVKFKWNYVGQYSWLWAIDDVSVSEMSEATWEGDESAVWDVPGNWVDNVVPGANTKVIVPISANDPVIQQDAVCYDLTIQSGAKLTVTPGYTLTVFNVLTNDAENGVTIESDNSGTGSLLAASTAGTGTAEVQRYMSGNQWHYISSPVDQTIATFLSNNSNIPTKSGSRGMMDFNTTGDTWGTYFTNGTSGNMETAKGYSLRTDADGSVTFNGTVHTGTQNIALSDLGSGWNLIGNPFISAISINSEAGVYNFLNTNVASFDPSFVSIYEWNGTGYDVINNASGAEYATVGQGFFVKSTGGDAAFTTEMQVHKPSVSLKSGNVIPEIKLLVSSAKKITSTNIKFFKDATAGLDKGYDAGILKADPSFSVFTHLVNDNNVEFALQCLPLTNLGTMTVPVGIDFSAGGEITFSAMLFNLPSDNKIVLEDRLLNVFTSFNDEKSAYTTTLAANSKGTGRFYLHVSDANVTGIDMESMANKINAWVDKNEIIISGIKENKAVATLYDLKGSSVLVRNLEKITTNRINVKGLKSGIYMLQVVENGKHTGIKLQITGN
jgi:hypothetical protein